MMEMSTRGSEKNASMERDIDGAGNIALEKANGSATSQKITRNGPVHHQAVD